MKLKEWLQAKEIRPSDFADRIGVEPAAVSRYCAGTRIPERDTMVKIIDATNGEVRADDFYVQTATEPPIEPAQETAP